MKDAEERDVVKDVAYLSLPKTIFSCESTLPRKDVAENGTLDAPRVVPDAADDADNDDVLANRPRPRGFDVPSGQALRSGLPGQRQNAGTVRHATR